MNLKKNFTILAVWALRILQGQAQGDYQAWKTVFPGYADWQQELVVQYLKISNGRYLVVYNGDNPPYNSMSPGIYGLACINQDGSVLWRSNWGILKDGLGSILWMKIHELYPGRFVAVNLSTDPQSGNNPKIYMAFFDENGQLLRAILHGGPDFYTGPGANSPPRWSYRPYSSCPSKDGGLLVCGHANRGNAFHAVTGPNGEYLGIVVDPQQVGPIPGGLYFFITRYSSDGDSLWTSVIPRRIINKIFENRPRSFIEKYLVFMQDSLLYSRELVPCDIRVRSDYSIDVLVQTQDFQGSGNPPGMEYPVFIFHFDAAGQYQWHQKLNIPVQPRLIYFDREEGGGIVVVRALHLDNGASAMFKSYYAGYNEADWTIQWDVYFNISGYGMIHKPFYLEDGRILFVRNAEMNSNVNYFNPYYELYLYNQGGQMLGSRKIHMDNWPGGYISDQTYWNTNYATAENCLILAGGTPSPSNNQYSDNVILEWCPDFSLFVGLEEAGVSDTEMQVYPNPGAGQYHMSQGQSVARLRVWDSRGVLALDVRPWEGRFSLEGRPAGLYLWEATDLEGRVHRGRLVQQAAE